MDKSLKKLSRIELLQLLLKVTETNEALLAENTKLREESTKPAKPKMNVPQSAKVGSIAEAALQANGYFDAAQRAADDYLREIKQLRDQLIARAGEGARRGEAAGAGALSPDQKRSIEQMQVQAEAYVRDVQAYADSVIARANEHAESIVASAQAKSDEIIARANRESQALLAQAGRQSDRNASGVQMQATGAAAGAYAQNSSNSKVARAAESAARVAGVVSGGAQQVTPILAQASNAAESSSSWRANRSDPSATGELMRRGRHVKLSNGAVL